MKKVSFGKQEQMMESINIDIIVRNINGQDIVINPIASIEQKRDFVETIWNFMYSANEDGSFEYRPYMFEPAMRLMTLYVYTNISIDMKDPIKRHYNFLLYGNVYETVVSCLHDTELIGRDYDQLVKSAKDYIEFKCKEISDYRAMYIKGTVDSLLENILTQISTILEKFSANEANFDVKEVSDLISYFGGMKNNKDVVEKIVEFATNNKKDGGQNETTEREAT